MTGFGPDKPSFHFRADQTQKTKKKKKNF